MKSDQKFWFKWMFNYSVGELLGIGAATVVARFLFTSASTEYETNSHVVPIIILIIAGTFEGIIIGYIQWRSLSRLVSGFKPAAWIIITTLAAVVGWLLVLPPAVVFISFLANLKQIHTEYLTLYAALAGIGFGAIIGVSQFFIMRKFYKKALIWVLANSFGWMFSFLIVFAALQMFSAESLLYNSLIIVIACVLSGFIQGIITGTSIHFTMTVRKEHEIKSIKQVTNL